MGSVSADDSGTEDEDEDEEEEDDPEGSVGDVQSEEYEIVSENA